MIEKQEQIPLKRKIIPVKMEPIIPKRMAPGTTLLSQPEGSAKTTNTVAMAKVIQQALDSFGVQAEVRPEDISVGPTIIRFGIRPTGKPKMRKGSSGKFTPVLDESGQIVYETRTKVKKIMELQDDLALALLAKSIRMEAPVPGRPYVGVEIPNKNGRIVTLREILESKVYKQETSKLTIGLGQDIAGMPRVADLACMPHLLIAGATGSGKSVMINSIIVSILSQASPASVRFLMVDPKMVELSIYDGIPHLLLPVVTDVSKVVSLLKSAIAEMERRYRLFSELGVRNLDGYRERRKQDKSLERLPAIVIIIDELADLMMAAKDEVEGMICRLAQLARATGIHLVVATQRPSVDVITGLIKANIPARIAFTVSSQVDSRTIIDQAGAEKLIGKGDMLYLPSDAGRPERIQGAFLGDEEAARIVNYWKKFSSKEEEVWNLEEVDQPIGPDDDMLEKAERIIREEGKSSITFLQKRLRIGYVRASSLVDRLKELGVIE